MNPQQASIPCCLTFGPWSSEEFIADQQRDAMFGYCEALRRRGKILQHEVIATVDGQAVCYVSLVSLDALEEKWRSRYELLNLEELAEHFGRPPIWEILGSERPKPVSWQDCDWLYLDGGWQSDAGLCIKDGTSGQSVAFYSLPLDADVAERFIFRARNLAALDRLWFQGVLEMTVWRELADHRSRTNVAGRELARQLEAACGKPVAISLIRYYGFGEKERHRKCPSCKGKWRLNSKMAKAGELDFYCASCRLASTLGPADDQQDAASYGYDVWGPND